MQFEDSVRGPVSRDRRSDALPPVLAALKMNSELNVQRHVDPKLQSVVDAKSIFDSLARDCDGKKGEDRTAIELNVIRESMSRLDSSIRWVPHTHTHAGRSDD